MVISCDKIFLLVSKYMSLWSWTSLELAIIGGICVSQTHLVFFIQQSWLTILILHSRLILFADKTSMNSSTQWRLPWLEWSVVPSWEWKDQLPSRGWEACDAPSCPGQLVSRNAQCVFKWSSKWWAICHLPCNISYVNQDCDKFFTVT